MMQEFNQDYWVTKEFPYGDNVAIVTREGNPYGFYRIYLKSGVSPKEFDGFFTSIRDAEMVINRAITKSKTASPEKGHRKNGSPTIS